MSPCSRRRPWRLFDAMLLARLICASVAVPACAQTALYMNNVPPWAYESGGRMQGAVFDLLREMAARGGYDGTVQPVPFKRMEALLAADAHVLGAIWRQPENEADYTWLVKLISDPVVLVARADSPLDLSSLDSARGARVGVILGSPPELMARRLKLPYLDISATAQSNARKLAVGRIDLWLAVRSVAIYGEHVAGIDPREVRFGPAVGTVEMYLACARGCAFAGAARWQAALESMRGDGAYARIMERYGLAPGR